MFESQMKIAILGWGSLIWEPRDLKIVGKWSEKGPVLNIEFSRISTDARLTLVIDEIHGTDVRALFIISSLTELSAAIENLRAREKTRTDKIGLIVKGKSDACPFAVQHHPKAVNAIRVWLNSTDADAVIWTALEPDFSRAGEPFSLKVAQRYFNQLTGETKERALTYIQNAPTVVDTPLRRLLGGGITSQV